MMSMALWGMALGSQAWAVTGFVPLSFNPCPPHGSCTQNLRAIDGVVVPWDQLQVVTDEGLVDPVELRIELQIDLGSVELWMDGARLDPRNAEQVERGVYVWYVPITPRSELHFESVNLVDGLSIYRATVEGLTGEP